MEKQKLPNEQAIMILGIVSFIGCCCTNGVLGLVLSGIGLYLTNQSEKLIQANPEQYNPGSLSTWKIVNIVSFAISTVFVIYLIYLLATGKYQESNEQMRELIEQFQNR
ncbi:MULTISPECIES: CCC motif membrane protein [Flavobacterium]|uniref:CCC motif membrane protein n=1 Tax=Flavobacterium jumunjinense TaxID=998845 RepID=A0ABV5GRJ3_9FLAO|nr:MULTISPECIES: CCC motif membrane protein [Flavobacterium]